MKIQISFDMTDLDKALEIATQIADYADILEIGTLLIYKNGIDAVKKFKELFNQKTILVDSKIVDRGKDAATLFAKADTDWITVMAGTSKDVIHTVCTTAHSFNKKVMLDLLDSSSPGQSALEARNLGVDALLFHQPYDTEESLLFLDNWDLIKGNSNLPIFVSAKIKRDTINEVIKVKPDGVIISKSVTTADDPREEAQFFYDIIKQGNL